ncbi:hypothetical protein [Propionispora hippei]|uniref:Lipoprotein n=1 Tax=Propionispora hippei DSM 15287 TaxID=1123003 RepID=A0A1M6E1X5_9FIRM|nr:hypothetical protein [Propionispora hippei]SHI79405.1 hypothetical protein SAMN02745170_01095 [Propionispora hippei DSM 15287]
MKKNVLLTVLCLLALVMGNSVLAQEAPDSQKVYNIAIVPYFNSTEEKAGYVEEIVNGKYTEQYSNQNFHRVPLVEVQKALNEAGYDVSNMELPDKDVLATVARQTNADYVIAMEISELITTRHLSYFQNKVVTKTKLRYKFYNAGQDKVTSFQVTGLSENKAVFGYTGYKDPITKALNQALDDANQKVMTYL